MSPPRILPAFLRQAGRHSHLAPPTLRSRDLEEIVRKMCKRIIARPLHSPPPEKGWLDLESTASVEVTSEDNAFQIESALLQQDKGGWRAAEPGAQTIRLIFDEPQRLRRISVYSRRPKPSAHKNSPCDGRQIGEVPSGKSCGSSGISARRTPHERPRSTRLTFQMSHCLT